MLESSEGGKAVTAMQHMGTPPSTRAKGNRRRKGVQLIEFTLVMVPLLSMIFVLVDTSWAVYAKATLQRAVREGVRTGITLTSGDMVSGACLTDTVKRIVQAKAFGFLAGSGGLSKIKVHYFEPPASTSTAAADDVSDQANGNKGGNIIEVSVQGFSLAALLPRIFGTQTGSVDKSPFVFSVYAADVIEPTTTPPCIGTAP